MDSRAVRLAALLLVLLASAAIVSTYRVFSQTYDEPGHVAAGMEWWQTGHFTFEEQHPPLGRAAVALGPYLAGLRLTGSGSMWVEGNAILYAGGRYQRNLALARAGALPFFLLACAAVWLWARYIADERAALVALAFFVSTSPVLGHGGLATTDMAITGTLATALFCFLRWLDRPAIATSIVLGIAVAAAVMSKLSALLFLPIGAAVLTVTCWRSRPAAVRGRIPYPRALGIAAWVSVLAIWATYRFSVRWMGAIPLPAPELVAGAYQVLYHNSVGHMSFLLGERRNDGWWYYFPVVLAVKTPLPLLVASVLGVALPFQGGRRNEALRQGAPALIALALLASVLPSNINIGVRYVLPLFPMLAISAGVGALHLYERERHRRLLRGAFAILLIWQFFGALRAHPDYMPYFNELAGGRPERVVVDSDLDWGQDLLRLADTVRQRQLERVSVAYYGSAVPAQHLASAYRALRPAERADGCIAISERLLAGIVFGEANDGYAWLRKYNDYERIGKSIRLLGIPSDACRPPPIRR